MDKLTTFFASQPVILLDGAMGTMLMNAGLPAGRPPEEWNLLAPEKIGAVHQAYVQAGSRLILANTFNANRFRLSRHQLQEKVSEMNMAGVAIARSVAEKAPYPILVGASMGPTGEMFPPMGSLTFENARDAYAEQASALVDGGVDLLWIETMIDLQEVKAAIAGIRSVTGLPFVATMTFEKHGRTMMGATPALVLKTIIDEGAQAVGANCGTGPQVVEKVISAMRESDHEARLIAKANAGLPRLEGDEMVYDGTPAVMAAYAARVQQLGASLIGACCGSTPAHLLAMADALQLQVTG